MLWNAVFVCIINFKRRKFETVYSKLRIREPDMNNIDWCKSQKQGENYTCMSYILFEYGHSIIFG